MAFFPRQFHSHNHYNHHNHQHNNNASFTPLFRLLDDFDNYSRQSTRQSNITHWQPKFDVRETEQAYELHGEFPGVNKENVHIEFTEPQTMLIRGRNERTYTSGTPPTGLENTATSGAITENGQEQNQNSSHHATVEDESESVSHEAKQTERPEAEDNKQEQPVQKKPTDKAKYWLTERTVGEFSRSFNFPTRVDQEAVTANFNDGILAVVVPKAKKHETRRIAVL